MSTPGLVPFMSRIAPAATVVIGVLAVAAVVVNITAHDWLVGGSGLSGAEVNALIAVVALGLGIFVWAAAWGHPLVLGGVFIGWWIGLGLWLSYAGKGMQGVTWAICATAVTSFVAILMAQGATQTKTITKNSMRNAIAGSFVLTYLVTVGLVVFWRGGEEGKVLSPIASQLVPNFTVLMGVIIAFYFGTTAVEKVAELKTLSGAADTQARHDITAAAEE